ncbi:GMC oxidoreductase [Luteimonas saliphila]|uniref:GMC oxidoreductase n=1 Tax=Luteimonas saliphila TaxID=2804919 RepID=UPI00308020AB
MNADLQVYGIDRLRIADASIMPDVPSGNTMAPCVVIGERATEIIRKAHGI